MRRTTIKRFLAAGVTALMLFSAAACGGNGGSNEPVHEAKTRDNHGVTLIWYVPKSAQDDDAMVYEAANKIIGEKLEGLQVDFVSLPGDYSQKIQPIIGAGEEFDICFTCSWMNNYKGNVDSKAFVALDDYNGENLLLSYAPELWDLIPEKIWEGTKINGHIYGVPNYQISTSGKSFWFQKDLVDKYGFDINTIKGGKDWRSLEEFFKLVKANDPDKFPTESNQIWGLVASCEGFVDGAIGGTGYRIDDPDNTFINEYKEPEFKAYLETCKEWYDNGYVRSDIATVQDTTKDKKIGRYASGWGTTKPGMEAEMKNNYGYEVVTVKMTDDMLTTSSSIATMNAVSRTSKNPEAAVQLLNLINTDPELYNIIVHGIEGTHWEKAPELGDNYIKTLDGATDKYQATDWMMGCVFNGYLQEGQQPDVWDKTKEMNENAVADALIGFSFDTTKVQSEVSNVDATRDKYLRSLEYGITRDLDGDLAKMLDELDKAGMEAVLNEMNLQVYDWKESK